VRVTWEDVRRALASREPALVDEPGLRRAAVAVILREGAAGLEMLFIRRAEHPEDPWSGQMGFPGGRSEPQDADLRTTAVRETAEEIGVDLEREAEFLGALDEVRAMARLRPVNLCIAPFVYRVHGSTAPRPSVEVGSVHWLPLDPLLGPAFRSTTDYLHGETSLQFPCLRVEDLVIWGLTYRMFTLFQELLEASRTGVSGATDEATAAG
jgi:8-oxo-dGTP pyrophosphatase MutT (NUDIX family)